MNPSGDVAEQIVHMSLEGVEVTAKIAGQGAKQIAAILYAILKDQNKTHGKIRLANMLRSGKELKVFTVKNSDLKKFAEEAKRYGVLYCGLKKSNSDGVCDILVRAEDASKINRIVERFHMESFVDGPSIVSEIKKEKEKDENAKEIPEKSKEERIIDDLMGTEKNKDTKSHENPMAVRTEVSRPSGKNSKNSRPQEKVSSEGTVKKPSVKEQLREIKASQEKERSSAHEKTRGSKLAEQTRQTQHKQPQRRKRGKSRKGR